MKVSPTDHPMEGTELVLLVLCYFATGFGLGYLIFGVWT